MENASYVDRRDFMKTGAAAAGLHLAANLSSAEEKPRIAGKRIRVGVIGCGRVSEIYLLDLLKSPQIELVSTCDIIPQRAKNSAKKYGVPNHFPHIDKLLAGPNFDLMLTLTDMQEHYHLNKQALEAGLNVWSEKPMGTTYAQASELLELAKKKGVLMFGAPTVVSSPQFAFMAEVLKKKRLGRVAAAHATYGHYGPSWSTFFYDEDGGSMFDLGVYQITSLTGLLGPAKSVVAMTSIVTPTRKISGKGKVVQIEVKAEDNAMILLDHGSGAISHIQCGFSYYTSHLHDDTDRHDRTMTIIGDGGTMDLAGYDWAPKGVDLLTKKEGRLKRQVKDTKGYLWEWGARKFAEHLAGGAKPSFAPEHAAHVVEIIESVKRSQKEGRQIKLHSTFNWPVPI